MRKILAIVLPPLWVPLLSLTQVVHFRDDPMLASMSMGEIMSFIAGVGLVAGYLSMLIIGLPLHRFLLRTGRRSLWEYAVAGLLAGALVRALLIALVWLQIVLQTRGAPLRLVIEQMIEAWTDRPLVFLTAALMGMLVFATLWVLVRPDRKGRQAVILP